MDFSDYLNVYKSIFPVDFAPVTCFNHYDQQTVINYIQDYTIFTNSVSVERVTFCPFDLFYIRIWVIFDIINR